MYERGYGASLIYIGGSSISPTGGNVIGVIVRPFVFGSENGLGEPKHTRSEVFRNGLNDAGHKDWSICNILRQQSLIIGIRLHLPVHLRIFWSVFSSWSGKTLGVRMAA